MVDHSNAVAEKLTMRVHSFSHADMQKFWLQGDWSAMVGLDLDEIKKSPDAAAIFLWVAAAFFQLGQFKLARNLIDNCLAMDCDPDLVQRVLIAGVHNNLATANALIDNTASVVPHYQQSVEFGLADDLAANVALQRMINQCTAIQSSNSIQWSESMQLLLTKAQWDVSDHSSLHEEWSPSAEVLRLVRHCIEATDLHAAVDHIRQQAMHTVDDSTRLSFFLALAQALMQLKKDKMTALSYVQYGKRQMETWTVPAACAVTSALVDLGQATLAAEFVTEMTLRGIGPILLRASERDAIDKVNTAVHQAGGQKSEHGHDLLLVALSKKITHYKAKVAPRKPALIEIGTTREDVPGQGSTRKIALFCKQHGIDFITVDMDPHNSLLAREMFAEMGLLHFQAITMKGEDYLKKYEGALDFVFLDAYDFDHGNHSEIRQSRYRQFLGSGIDELQCHHMHLDCAQSVLAKLTPGGLLCVDDTWLDNGKWAAKGTLAMPFLLSNGFTLLEARNRAALLGKA